MLTFPVPNKYLPCHVNVVKERPQSILNFQKHMTISSDGFSGLLSETSSKYFYDNRTSGFSPLDWNSKNPWLPAWPTVLKTSHYFWPLEYVLYDNRINETIREILFRINEIFYSKMAQCNLSTWWKNYALIDYFL